MLRWGVRVVFFFIWTMLFAGCTSSGYQKANYPKKTGSSDMFSAIKFSNLQGLRDVDDKDLVHVSFDYDVERFRSKKDEYQCLIFQFIDPPTDDKDFLPIIKVAAKMAFPCEIDSASGSISFEWRPLKEVTRKDGYTFILQRPYVFYVAVYQKQNKKAAYLEIGHSSNVEMY